jgi:trehalose 6-phosphate synthase
MALTWIASAMGEGDRRVAEGVQGGRFKSPSQSESLHLRFVVTPKQAYHKFYSIFCNPLLWFLQHYMWNSPHTPNINRVVYDAWENGYLSVNQAFAQAVLEEVKGSTSPPLVMIHDYHLYLAAAYIRREMPHLILQHFTHIPWPEPTYWQLLPLSMRQAICQGLCAADIVGLQTRRDVHNFLYCCQSFLEGAEVDYKEGTVGFDGHLTRVNAYPVSVDAASLKSLASSAKVQEYERKLRPLCGEYTIVRVDRAEPSKNIVRGFKSFDMLLERYPHLRGKIKFLSFLVPTRTHLRPYQRYKQELDQLVEDINIKYGFEGWRPIEVFYENNYLQAVAGMRLYDVLFINAVIDGMNLVAKEGPIVNNRDGVLILSEATGAHEQLGQYALSVAPADLEGTMEALYTALNMSRGERSRRAAALRRLVEEEDVNKWLYRQLKDLADLSQRSVLATPESVPHPRPR